ncbi:hypothetical protein F5Y16DRAFT_398366 [Xylariaceae sp. FL0255]|nr:hypothetical protein F5Y16DRAFT_398366 [Xylariaceae sp. FL0255]
MRLAADDVIDTSANPKRDHHNEHECNAEVGGVAPEASRHRLSTGGSADGASPLYVRKGETAEMHFKSTFKDKDKDVWEEDADEFRP